MVEPIEPETNFEQDDPLTELDELAEQLENEGFDPDEIEEALYDPAPRRRRGRRGRRMHRRSYNPAPRRRRRGRRGRGRSRYGKRKVTARRRRFGGRAIGYIKRKKGTLAKFRKYVLPGVTIGSFYLSYAANAKARGMTLGAALKADLQNWDANKVWAKIQASPVPAIGTIAIPIAKRAVPQLRNGTTGLITDVVQGILTGQFITQVIDEPAPLRTAARAMEVRRGQIQASGLNNPYGA